MASTRRVAHATTLALLSGAAVALGPTGPAQAATVVTFDTVGSHDWTPPDGVTRATFDVYGAQGGAMNSSAGGRGGRATVTLDLIPGVDYQVNVGGKGSDALGGNVPAAGGSNGGGAGGAGGVIGGGGGGGASDVRYGDNTVDSRIVVAGGGGGTTAAVAETSPGQQGIVTGGVGGAGGAPNGAAGTSAGGGGGTQSAGGAQGTSSESQATPGSLAAGGNGVTTSQQCCSGAGGGGGYYGGGGGGIGLTQAGLPSGGGGGGGSSFGPTGTVFTTGANAGDGKVIIRFVVGTYQPDLSVKRSTDTSYVGANIYSATASGEQRSWPVAVGSSRTFKIRLENDGNTAGAFTLKGTGSTTKFTVTYLSGTTNVTTAMVAGTLTASGLAAGASRVYSVRIKATSQARKGDVGSATVKAVSKTDATAIDAVKARVTVG